MESSSRSSGRPATAASSATWRAGAREAGDRRAHGTAKRGRRTAIACSGGAGALQCQQRVAVGGGDDSLAGGRIERADGVDQRFQLGPPQRLQLQLADRHTAPARGMHERVDFVAPRRHAPGEHDQDGQRLDPACEVGRELERRRVGDVHVVEQQRQWAVGGGVLGQLDRSLEQPGAGQLTRDVDGPTARASQPARQRRREPAELLRPLALGRRRLELARQTRQQLDPGRERRRTGNRAATAHAAVAGAGAGDQLAREARLADPALAAQHGHRAATRLHLLPQPGQRVELGVAADQRRALGTARRRRLAPAQSSGQRARLLGGGEAERLAQTI